MTHWWTPWRRSDPVSPAAPTPADVEAAEALAAARAQASEVSRLARVLHRLLEDNHLSPRIAALYTRDE